MKALKLLGLGVICFAGLVGLFVLYAIVRGPVPSEPPPLPPRVVAPIPEPTPPPAHESAPRSSEPSFAGDGTFLVGTDVLPGTYRTRGGEACYWARLSNLSGSLDAILANDTTSGPAIVQIQKTDKAFQSKRCAEWQIVK